MLGNQQSPVRQSYVMRVWAYVWDKRELNKNIFYIMFACAAE